MSENNRLEHLLAFFLEHPHALHPEARSVERRDTHISAVLLTENLVFKFKKAVDYGFIRQTKLNERLESCRLEVGLNGRLASDVYLGVHGVFADGASYRLGEATEPATESAIEYCVVMRRLSNEYNLLEMVRNGTVGASDIDSIARVVADFHAKCDRGPEVAARRDFFRNMEANLAAIDDFLASEPPAVASEFSTVCAAIRAYTQTKSDQLQIRGRAGTIVDGHGDLRLDHIYIEPDGIRIIDCVEFNADFRAVDPFEDLAFAGMGLKMEGMPDLGRRLELVYTGYTTDVRGFLCAPVFELYRAGVRAKIDAIQCRNVDGARADYFRKRFYGYLRLMQNILDNEQAQKQPTLVAVGGLPASGKSTYAQRLMMELNAPILSTDNVRKRLSGLRPLDDGAAPAFSGIYAPSVSRNTYRYMEALAALLLHQGHSVVLDGTFSQSCGRQRLRKLAERTGAKFRFFEVVAGRDTIRRRLAARAPGSDISDLRDFGTWERLAAKYETPGQELGNALVRIDTDAGLTDIVAEL